MADVTQLLQGRADPIEQRSIVRGFISTSRAAPTGFTKLNSEENYVWVIVPEHSTTVPYGPCNWSAEHGTTLPAQGAACLLALDQINKPVIVWWEGNQKEPSGSVIETSVAMAYRKAAQGIPDKTFTKIKVDTIIKDPGGNIESEVGYKVPAEGYYQVSGQVIFDGIYTAALVAIYVNGVEKLRGTQNGGAGIQSPVVDGIVFATKGQKIELIAYQEAGAEHKLLVSTGEFNYLTVTRVGEGPEGKEGKAGTAGAKGEKGEAGAAGEKGATGEKGTGFTLAELKEKFVDLTTNQTVKGIKEWTEQQLFTGVATFKSTVSIEAPLLLLPTSTKLLAEKENNSYSGGALSIYKIKPEVAECFISGMVALAEGAELVFQNVSTTETLLLLHQNTKTALGTNRFRFPSLKPVLLQPLEYIYLFYSSTLSRWELFSGNGNSPWADSTVTTAAYPFMLPIVLGAKVENGALNAAVRTELNGTRVYLRGIAKVKALETLAEGETLLTLPENQRPKQEETFDTAIGAVFTTLKIATTGVVTLSKNVLAGETVNLSGINFGRS